MDWQKYLYGFAEHAATKSKDSTKVGAVIVGPNNEIRSTGFNGPPMGVNETDERRKRPLKYLLTAHGESNAIAFAARNGVSTQGCAIYVTHYPCADCAKLIIQAGIKKVVVGPNTTSMPQDTFDASRAMFTEAGVFVENVIGQSWSDK